MVQENQQPPAQQPPGQAPQQSPAPQQPPAIPPTAPPPAQQPPPQAPPSTPPPAQSAPEEIEVTLPQGVPVDPEALREFKSIMGDPKTSLKQKAQAVVDLQVRQGQVAEKKYQESVQQSVAAWKKKNEDSLRADPDFGKDFEANKAIAQRPLAAYGDPDLARELAAMGLENHPRLTKFLHKIGTAMGESKTPVPPPVPPGQDEEAQRNAELDKRYPAMTKRLKREAGIETE